MVKKIYTLFLMLVAASAVFAQILPDPNISPETHLPVSTKIIKLGDIKPLRDIAPHLLPPQTYTKTWSKDNFFKSNEWRNPDALPKNGDPLATAAKNNENAEFSGIDLEPGLNFEGLRDNSGVTPPDPVGDIGLNHYVQMINSSNGAWFQVWDKQGNSVYGPALTSTIWSQVGSGSIGDPIIQYDHDAQRWLMMEMQGFGENQLLVAISDDSDPTGSWKAYRIQCEGFPDYPKLYVWPSAYFITVNETISTNLCSGYALDRNALLYGDSVVNTYRFQFPNYQAIRYQPATGADWEGGPPPPPGSPGLIFRLYDDAWDGGSDQIQLWQIFVNWDDPNQNYAIGPTSFQTTPFETRVCYGAGLFNCIEQPQHPAHPRLTALENIIMYRAPYRNFGTYESIVLNHVSDISGEVGDGGDAAIRWYEFRKNAGELNWTIFQEGTYAPDMNNRFTGTISQDEQGSIAIGYTTASIITYPGIRITGRRVSDPLGIMSVNEYTLVAGGKSHSGDSRWGDYSNMTVDPVDGKTFWYVSEYQPTDASWGTRIGTFQISRDSFDVTPVAINEPVNSALLTNKQVKVSILNGGIIPASGVTAELYVDGTLMASESITETIAPNNSVLHTFQPLLSWNTIGEIKHLMVVTKWIEDEFAKNDTVRTTVKKLATFDASIPGVYGLPGLLCTTEENFGIILRNSAGYPLDSVQIRWNVNTAPVSTINWQGHLLPGQQDTVPLFISGLLNGQNLLKIRTILPNGQIDQDSLNDKYQQKLYINIDGALLSMEAKSEIGLLAFEIRDGSNNLINTGIFGPGQDFRETCTSNSTCYKLILKSATFRWEGEFYLYDILGNVLVSAFDATPQGTSYSFCTPARNQNDIGAFDLISPATGPNLTANEPISVAVRNFGLLPQNSMDISWREVGGNWYTETWNELLPGGATKSFTFSGSNIDISSPGATKNIEIKATISADQNTSNDIRIVEVSHKVNKDLALESLDGISCYQSATNSIEFWMANKGLTPIDSFKIDYIINGTNSNVTFNNQYLQPGENRQYILQIAAGVIGLNDLKVRITDVDGLGPDNYTANNEKTITYEIDPNRIAIDLYIGLDDAPRETSWELRYAGGSLLANGSGYTEKEGSIFQRFCVHRDSCLVFKLLDSANDGMGGSVLIQEDNNNQTLWSYYGVTDTFTAKIETQFCATTACSGFSAAFNASSASGPNIADGSIAVIVSGGTAPFTYSINNMAPQSSPVFTGLLPGEYVMLVLDANSCTFYGIVNIGTTSAINELAPKRELMVSPNPTKNFIALKMDALSDEQNVDCTLYDATGKAIRQFQMSRFNHELLGICSLEKNPAGNYFVVVRQKNGQRVAEKVIQKIK